VRQSNHKAWHLRLAAWWRTTEGRLRRVWWLWPLIALTSKLTEHRALTVINDFLDTKSGLAVRILKAIVSYVPSDPLVFTTVLFLFVVGVLVVHAYFDVKRKPAAPYPQEGALPPSAAQAAAPPDALQSVEEAAAQRNAPADWEMRRDSAIHAIVADYNQAMHHPDNAAKHLAAAGSASAILWKTYTTEQEREPGSQFHNAYTSILNATRDLATVSPERLHLAILDIARLADLTDLVLDPPTGQPAPADAQAKGEEEREQQRQRAIEGPEVEEVRVVYRQVLGRAVERACESAIDELILRRADGNEAYMLIRRMLNACLVPPCRHAQGKRSANRPPSSLRGWRPSAR
jgi:hypothetical protein